MDSNYIIRIKLGEMEIEVSGDDKDFVSENFEYIFNEIKDNDFLTVVSDTTEMEEPVLNTNFVENSPVQSQEQTQDIEINESSDDPILRFAKDAGITHEKLLEIFDFTHDDVYIHKKIEGNVATQNRIIAKLVLIANEYVFGKTNLSGKKIGSYLRELKIDSNHLAHNLKNEEEIIMSNNKYRLNAPGKKKVLKMIQDLANEND